MLTPALLLKRIVESPDVPDSKYVNSLSSWIAFEHRLAQEIKALPGSDLATDYGTAIEKYLRVSLANRLRNDNRVSVETTVRTVLKIHDIPVECNWFGLQNVIFGQRFSRADSMVFIPEWQPVRESLRAYAPPLAYQWLLDPAWRHVDPTWGGLHARILILLKLRSVPDNMFEQIYRVQPPMYQVIGVPK